jgi:hypothetical protein
MLLDAYLAWQRSNWKLTVAVPFGILDYSILKEMYSSHNSFSFRERMKAYHKAVNRFRICYLFPFSKCHFHTLIFVGLKGAWDTSEDTPYLEQTPPREEALNVG